MHTKGPWEHSRMRLGAHEKDRRSGFVVNGPDTNAEDLPIRVCDLRVPCGSGGFNEGKANARLIAAAPELLEAMKNALGDLSHIPAECVPDATDRERLITAASGLRAAVAKATT